MYTLLYTNDDSVRTLMFNKRNYGIMNQLLQQYN